MIKRTVEISGNDIFVRLQHKQVEVHKKDNLLAKIPAEDVGVVIIDCPSTVYTHGSVVELSKNGAVVVLCDKNHTPVSVVLPVDSNSIQSKRAKLQASFSDTKAGRLWKQIIQHKVLFQAKNIDDDGLKKRIEALLQRVKVGDKTNIEARASRLYWPAIFNSESFRRRRDGKAPNNLLNYGYMIFRASISRAICGAGLNPAIGLHHKNQFNSFCLSDDLLEVYRPLVDREVKALIKDNILEINKESKSRLLSLLTSTISYNEQKGPFLVACEYLISSLCDCYLGQRKELDLPMLWN